MSCAPDVTRNPFTQTETPAVGVTIENLSKSFGTFEVLKNVTFSVKPGEIFVLMGPSGSGKSVLLKHIVGLEMPTGGKVTVDRRDAASDETRERVRMALVFQAGALFNSMSVYDNLALYPREHKVGTEASIREKVMHALQILSLENAAQKFPSELSGGMKKRVAIARALVIDPQVILYDEPTSELDPLIAVTIGQEIKRLNQDNDVTSIVVTHDRDLAFGIADRIALMHEGKVLQVGTPKELQSSKNEQVQKFLNASFKF
jgi:phospholipid/cholesterol/gamma-HCH transport system ATP-binding protein